MKDFNRILLIGRLGADPEQRTTPSGTAMCKFPLATSRRVKGKDDAETFTDETQWHRVVAWGKEGESCAQFLKKGHPVFVEGSLRSHKFSGKDGVQRMSFEVHADRVNFLGTPQKRAAAEAEAQVQEVATQTAGTQEAGPQEAGTVH